MIGAGVFVVFREAYAITPGGYYLAFALAALVAALNATSVYRLATQIDRPGGIYAYSRQLVSKPASFLAGSAFTLGKIGSIAAIALVFAEYLADGSKLVAVVAIVSLTLVNLLGINRTALVAAVIASLSMLFLTITVVSSWQVPSYIDSPHREYFLQPNLDGWHVLQAAAIFFFAFAGYARVATLGNEVSKPKTNIPRAIAISLVVVVLLYFAIGWQLERIFGQDLHVLQTPVARLAELAVPWIPAVMVQLIVSVAALGSMLALLAGVSRTVSTMAEDREVPQVLSKRNRFGAPLRAELAIAISACALVFLPTLTWVVGVSSFCVLVYYAIGHIAALKQKQQPQVISLLGLLLCVALVVSIDWPTALACGLVLLALVVVRKLTYVS